MDHTLEMADAPETVFMAEPSVDEEDLAAFKTWLVLGLQFKHIKPNAPRSLIHFIDHTAWGGLSSRQHALLVSPTIFQRFLAERYPDIYPPGTPSSDVKREQWFKLQMGFLRMYPHRRERVNGNKTTVFRYITASGGVFGAVELTQPEDFFMNLPASNPHVVGELGKKLAGLKQMP